MAMALYAFNGNNIRGLRVSTATGIPAATHRKRNAVLFILAGAILALLLFAMTPVAAAAPTTRYVATSGSDSGNNCTLTGSPCRTIQAAVDRSSSGDTIKVAQGTYTFSTNACSLPSPTIVCFVDKALTILGGYTTSNWTTANPTSNVTIVDGQNAYRGVAVIGNLTTTTRLDMERFTIQNCKVQGPTSAQDPGGHGAGMWVPTASVTLRDLIFKNNHVFGQNTSSGDGGIATGGGLTIVFSPSGASSLLQRVTFDGNQSTGGTGPNRGGLAWGAMFVNSATVTVQDSTFTNNHAYAGSSTGSGTGSDGLLADAIGGGLGLEASSSVLSHLTVTGNQVIGGNAGTDAGGGNGGGIFDQNSTSFSLSDSLITNNLSQGGNGLNGGVGGGGGIFLQDSAATIDRTYVISNTAKGGDSTGSGHWGPSGGGGLFLLGDRANPPSVTLTNLIIADNDSVAGTIGDNALAGGGGGVQVEGLTALFTHDTFARNRLGPSLVAGQAIWVLASPFSGVHGNANASYDIIADHTQGASGASAVLVQADASAMTFNHGLYAGNNKNDNSDGSPWPAGTFQGRGTMDSASSALFVSPGAPNYDYHIRSSSPAKDRAFGSTTPVDIDGEPRPFNGVSDNGADEYVGAASGGMVYLPFVVR